MNKSSKRTFLIFVTFIIGVVVGTLTAPYWGDEPILSNKNTKEAYFKNLSKVEEYEKEVHAKGYEIHGIKIDRTMPLIRQIVEAELELEFTKDDEQFWKTKNTELKVMLGHFQMGQYAIHEHLKLTTNKP